MGFLVYNTSMHSPESRAIASAKLLSVTGKPESEWNRSMAEVCGIGDEYFYTLKTDPNVFVYLCVEGDRVTSCETN